MKTISTLTAIVLIALSINSLADDKLKNKERSSAVSAAPFTWGDPENEAPLELKKISVTKLIVPVAPFVWGSPEDVVSVNGANSLLVPVAPFFYGNPDADTPMQLQNVEVKSLDVPVAPFVLGDADADAPTGI